MRDGRFIVMTVLIVLVAVIGGLYIFAGREGGSGGFAMSAGAIVLLLVLAGVSAGASRHRRVVRDEEERAGKERTEEDEA